MADKKNTIVKAAGGNAPEEEFQFILSLDEATGYFEMDLRLWEQWEWMNTLGKYEGEHALGLLWQAHVLAEQFHFAKARKAGLPEMEKAEKQWIIASILSKLLEEHLVQGFGDSRYPNQSRDHDRARSSSRIPERYRNSKNVHNRKIFPFFAGGGMERIKPNPFAPAVYSPVEKNGYE